MRRLVSALDRHWFAPASLRELAFVRIVVFGSQTLFFLFVPVGRFRPLSARARAPRSPTPFSQEPSAPSSVTQPSGARAPDAGSRRKAATPPEDASAA